jgi:hypothetical protein
MIAWMSACRCVNGIRAYHHGMTEHGVRTRNRYDASSGEPYALSRSKLELLLDCPRCFVLDRTHGIQRPDDMIFSLNLTVDLLLKREFDAYRGAGTPHPLMRTYGIDAVPFRHRSLHEWRDTPTGIRALHKPTNFLLYGIVDDLWMQPDGSLIVVDYKATSTGSGAHVADLPRLGYERQLEIYQWLLRRNGFAVAPAAYLLYANANRERLSFDARLEFSMHLVPHVGDDSWIEDALLEAKACLDRESLPSSSARCSWCIYRSLATGAEKTTS